MRVLLVDDHAVVRRGVRSILSEAFPHSTVVEADTVAQTLRYVIGLSWDLLVLDITLTDGSGLEVLSEVRKSCPKLPVLMLSIYPEEQFAVRCLRAGAAGYLNLNKQGAPEELVTAVHKLVTGGRYVSNQMAEYLADHLNSEFDTPTHATLSDREYEVMLMIASGKTAKEIGDRLSISIKTVSTYKTRIFEKLEIESNAELTRYALMQHLIA